MSLIELLLTGLGLFIALKLSIIILLIGLISFIAIVLFKKEI